MQNQERPPTRHAAALRHATYPPASHFAATFSYRDYLQAVASLRTRGIARPLALSVHIPFCDAACDGCRTPRNREHAAVYFSYLKREIEMQGRLFAGMNVVEQLHVWGGAPACLGEVQMQELMDHLRHWFRFAPDWEGDYTMCVGPGRVPHDRVLGLRRQGFNGISIALGNGGADAAGHLAETAAAAREAGFRMVGVDLSGAAPAAIKAAVAVRPDRITGVEAALAPAQYVQAGAGQLARRGSDMAVAHEQGRLHRNCNGYSVHPEMDTVACGLAAIAAVAGTYSQNARTLKAYYDRIERNELPIERGVRLEMDDFLRRTIINMLLCQFELSIPAIEQSWPVVFSEYFAAELGRLAQLEGGRLAEVDGEWITLTPRGRDMIWTVCMVFDRYRDTARR